MTSWQTDATVVAVDADARTFTVRCDDPALIVEQPGRVASDLTATVTMAEDNAMPAHVGQAAIVVVRLR